MFLLKPKKIFLMISICLFANLYCSAQTQADFDWINEHYYDEILPELFPTSKGLGWTVGFRIHGDLERSALEYSAAFSEKSTYGGGKIIVLVTKANSVSIIDQLLALRPGKRKQSVSRIKKQLKVKMWSLTEESCPSIRNSYSEFYKLNLEMLSNKDLDEKGNRLISIYLHPISYYFTAVISGGLIGVRLDEQDHPFVIWANKTRNLLDKCIEQQTK